jgi:hypothetical protein
MTFSQAELLQAGARKIGASEKAAACLFFCNIYRTENVISLWPCCEGILL